MDQLIALLLVLVSLGAALIAVIGPLVGLIIMVGRYFRSLWRGPFPENKI